MELFFANQFGKLPNGAPVTIYTLRNSQLEMRVMTFGARVVSISTPDRHDNIANVVLGYDNIDDYFKDNKTYFGAVPGRYANRIANADSTSTAGNTTLASMKAQIPYTAAKRVSIDEIGRRKKFPTVWSSH